MSVYDLAITPSVQTEGGSGSDVSGADYRAYEEQDEEGAIQHYPATPTSSNRSERAVLYHATRKRQVPPMTRLHRGNSGIPTIGAPEYRQQGGAEIVHVGEMWLLLRTQR